MSWGKDAARFMFGCEACNNVDLVLKEYRQLNASTDVEEWYMKFYCPVCGNTSHTIHCRAGIDIRKVVRIE
jgi:Zn finger protein HypA/HybF involved in hydrogenase expression